MTDGERLTAILAQYAIPCEKVSFRGKLDALAAGLGIQTQGRLMGDVLDDIAAKTGVDVAGAIFSHIRQSIGQYTV